MSDAPPPEVRFGRRADLPPADAGSEVAADAPAAPAPAAEAVAPPPPPPAAKEPPAPLQPALRRSKQSRGQMVVFLNFVLSCITVAVLAAGAIALYGRSAFDRAGPAAADATFTVKPRSGVGEIADQLERRGLITDARVFQIGVRVAGNGSNLKAGEYAIPAYASMRAIMETIASGKSILYSLTIPEGLTVEQALGRVAAQEELSGDMPAVTPPEGSLATDTQRFTRGTPRGQIVEKMMAEQKALVDEIWARRDPDLPLADRDEFVTLASIVEKETSLDAERARVAAVFVNRLEQRMRLQSDPTVIYGLWGGKGKPADRPITKADLEKPTPYNTYVIRGLPPTPIANPGRAALEAVANPADTDDLYFVADGTGGHAFADNLKEHNRNVARWRALEKERADAAGETDDAASSSIETR